MRGPIKPHQFLLAWCKRQFRILLNTKFGFGLANAQSKKKESSSKSGAESTKAKSSLFAAVQVAFFCTLIGLFLCFALVQANLGLKNLDRIIPKLSIHEQAALGNPIELQQEAFHFVSFTLAGIESLENFSQLTIVEARREYLLQEIEVSDDGARPEKNAFKTRALKLISELRANTPAKPVAKDEKAISEQEAEFIVAQLIEKGTEGFVKAARFDSPFSVKFEGRRSEQVVLWFSLYFLLASLAFAAFEGVSNSNPMFIAPEEDLPNLAVFPVASWVLFLIPLFKRAFLSVTTLLIGFAPPTMALFAMGYSFLSSMAYGLAIALAFSTCTASMQVCYQFVGRFSEWPFARAVASFLQLPSYLAFCLVIFSAQLKIILVYLEPFALADISHYYPPTLAFRALATGNQQAFLLALALSCVAPLLCVAFIRFLSRGGFPAAINSQGKTAKPKDLAKASFLAPSAAALRLMRDRSHFMATLLMPVVLFGFYTLQISEASGEVSSAAASSLLFGACCFIILSSLLNLVVNEGAGLWLLYTSGQFVRKVIALRVRFWAKLTLCIAAGGIFGLKAIGVDSFEFGSIIAILIGLPSMCYIATCLSFGAYSPIEGEDKPKPKQTYIYLLFGIAGGYNYLAFFSSQSSPLVAPILFSLLAVAFWDDFQTKLQYFFDRERTPKRADGILTPMLLCLAFYVVQSAGYSVAIEVSQTVGSKVDPILKDLLYAGSVGISGALISCAVLIVSVLQAKRSPQKSSSQASFSLAVTLFLAGLVSAISIFYRVELSDYISGIAFYAADTERLFWLLFFGVVLTPVAEEFLFRRVLLRPLLQKYSPKLAFVFTALVYASIHRVEVLPVSLILSLTCSWIYWRSGRLIWPILLSALVLLALLLFPLIAGVA